MMESPQDLWGHSFPLPNQPQYDRHSTSLSSLSAAQINLRSSLSALTDLEIFLQDHQPTLVCISDPPLILSLQPNRLPAYLWISSTPLTLLLPVLASSFGVRSASTFLDNSTLVSPASSSHPPLELWASSALTSDLTPWTASTHWTPFSEFCADTPGSFSSLKISALTVPLGELPKPTQLDTSWRTSSPATTCFHSTDQSSVPPSIHQLDLPHTLTFPQPPQHSHSGLDLGQHHHLPSHILITPSFSLTSHFSYPPTHLTASPGIGRPPLNLP